MAKKTQTSATKAAYGNRFSQQDVTTKEEMMQPQYLKTPQTKEGGIAFLAQVAKNKIVSFAKGN